MSAVVCGGKRSSYFEDHHPSSTASPIPISKKLRRLSPSPASPGRLPFHNPFLFDRLSSLFPFMDAQVLERALEASGNDIDVAINSLHNLCIGSAEDRCPVEETVSIVGQVPVADNGSVSASEDPSALNNLPVDGPEWVELFVKEMASATSLDDARSRAARALKAFEEAVSKRSGAHVVENSQQEAILLKQQIEAVLRENGILKRAVAIQHVRQKELEDKNSELEQLRQLVSQYQEQTRMLEVNNHALSMHLKQAQQSNSIPGQFNPDVF